MVSAMMIIQHRLMLENIYVFIIKDKKNYQDRPIGKIKLEFDITYHYKFDSLIIIFKFLE